MKTRQWEHAHILAAELTLLHAGDMNLIQQTVHYIRTQRPTAPDLNDWLGLRIESAAMFPRSLQTLPQMVTLRSLVEFITETYQEPQEIAEFLAWIARLMSYYASNRTEARTIIDERRPLLFVPEPPRIAPRVQPPRRAATVRKSSAPQPGQEDEISKEAEEFMKLFRQRRDE